MCCGWRDFFPSVKQPSAATRSRSSRSLRMFLSGSVYSLYILGVYSFSITWRQPVVSRILRRHCCSSFGFRMLQQSASRSLRPCSIQARLAPSLKAAKETMINTGVGLLDHPVFQATEWRRRSASVAQGHSPFPVRTNTQISWPGFLCCSARLFCHFLFPF